MEKSNKTFAELIKYWRDISGYDTIKCRQIFPSYDKWVYKNSIPRESSIQSICDKTGFKTEEILDAIKETKARKIRNIEGKKRIREFNLKYNTPSFAQKNDTKSETTDIPSTNESTLDFDEVLKEYMNYTKEKEALMEQFLDIKDRLEKVKANLISTRELLRKCV